MTRILILLLCLSVGYGHQNGTNDMFGWAGNSATIIIPDCGSLILGRTDLFLIIIIISIYIRDGWDPFMGAHPSFFYHKNKFVPILGEVSFYDKLLNNSREITMKSLMKNSENSLTCECLKYCTVPGLRQGRTNISFFYFKELLLNEKNDFLNLNKRRTIWKKGKI